MQRSASALRLTRLLLRCVCFHAPGARREFLRESFWPSDLNNRFTQELRCKTCQPIEPSQRSAMKIHTCEFCGKAKVRDDFWPHDLRSRWGNTLGCKTCKPIPPNERKRGTAAAQAKASSSMACPFNESASTQTAEAQQFRKRRRSKGPDIRSQA